MLNTPPHLEARVPRGFVSIFHGTSSSVARRRLRASDLSFRQSMPSFDIGRPGLQMQSGASAVLGGVGELPGSRCTNFNPRAPWGGGDRRPCRPDDGGISIHAPRVGRDRKFDDFTPSNLHKRYKRVLARPKNTRKKRKNKAKNLLTFTHFRPFWGAKVPGPSARLYFAPNTARSSARLRHHSPLWRRNARCGCDTYPQGSKSADCPRIHP